jgi:hypothetical protein
MRNPSATPRWTRHLVYRAEHTRASWKLRLGLPTLVVGGLWLTSGSWTGAIGRSLVCDASLAPSDAILVENFDPDYLLFERARNLRRAGVAARVLVPIRTDPGTQKSSAVALGIAEVMARISRIGAIEIVPIREVEPITLNAARDVQRFLVSGKQGASPTRLRRAGLDADRHEDARPIQTERDGEAGVGGSAGVTLTAVANARAGAPPAR